MSVVPETVDSAGAPQLSILEEAKVLRGNVAAARDALGEAQARLAEANDTYEREMRRRLVGKTVIVSGYTDRVEVMIQDGFEFDKRSLRLEEVRATVLSLFVGEDRAYPLDPLMYLNIGNEGRNRVGVRLFGLTHIEIAGDEAMS